MLHISVLGQFRVRIGERDIPPDAWKRRKAAAIVKILALAPDHRLHREQMMELLWPELHPEQAANSLYQALHALRRTVDPVGAGGVRHVILRDQVVQINPDIPVRVDVVTFEDAGAAARRLRDWRSYRQALELYTGDLLPDDRYEPWASDRREELRDEYISLLLELADLHDETGDHSDTIAELRRVVGADPLHEPAHRALMRLYARSGHRQHAIRQFDTLRDALASELEVEPEPESERLIDQIRAGDSAELVRHDVPPGDSVHPQSLHNLPAPMSSFIGREREAAEVRALLGAARLLTLTGSGGCGKSRLALEVAGTVLDDYADGVWLVELAALTDPELVSQAIATALDIREMPGQPLSETLQNWLKTRGTLIVLDNCEHLIDACARAVEGLLRASPGLRVLATSREPLRIGGELTWLVPSLSLPDPRQHSDPDELLAYESVQLFVDRASQIGPGFTLTSENAAAVAQLCYRLDGIPLAIELAAARVRALNVGQIVERLDDRFQLLSGGSRAALSRQQTLRAALDWSYDLLSEPECILFARLAVFSGSFDLDATEHVCDIAPLGAFGIADLLTLLVDRSLVVVSVVDGSIRYSLLETMREYARERLAEHGETDALHRAHSEYYSALAARADRQIRGAGSKEWLARLEGEHDNLRAALEWRHDEARCGSPEAGLTLAGTLHWFWHVGGHFTEGRGWLTRMLASGRSDRTRGLALATTGVGVLSMAVGEYGEGRRLLDESVVVWRELSDLSGLAVALVWLGHGELFHGRVAEARARHREALVLFTELNDSWGTAMATHGLGLDAVEADEHALGSSLFDGSLSIFRELGDDWGTAITLQHMANLTYRSGDLATARQQIAEVLVFEQRMGDTWLEIQSQSLLGEIARAQGDYETAAVAVDKGFAIAADLLHFVGRAWISRNAGFVALAQGDISEARARFREGLLLFQLREYPLGMVCCLMGMAGVAAAEERYELAARLLGAVEGVLEEIQLSLAPADRIEAGRIAAATQAALGDVAFERARADGYTLSLDDAVSEVDRLF
ncbi:BTAD domain-containing putative transcriptional regulator [soil metagenome]